MNRIYRLLVFITLVIGVVYFQHKEVEFLSDKDYSKLWTEPPIYISSIGYNRKLGNIVGIQPFMVPADYSSEERFYRKLESYILEAQRNGFLNDQTIVVFPEHIGTPLVLLDEEKSVYYQNDLQAVIKILTKNFFYVASKKSKNDSSLIQKLFIYKSKTMKQVYTKVFSQLSKFYNLTILAGSILLPNPKLENSEILIEGEELKNASFIFAYGKALPLVTYKHHLASFEEIARTTTNVDLPIYQIPNINLSFLVLLSNDSLYNQSYSTNVDIILAPSAVYEKQKVLWQDPAISDTLKGDRSLFTENDKNLSQVELWNKFGLAGKFPYLTNKIYLQVFLRGEFFGYKFIGDSSLGYRYIKTETVPTEFLTAILNIYF